jgi:ribulose kinase
MVFDFFRHIQQYLNDLLKNMAKKQGTGSVSTLTSSIHVWPDFHGNRSPLADPSLLGMVISL